MAVVAHYGSSTGAHKEDVERTMQGAARFLRRPRLWTLLVPNGWLLVTCMSMPRVEQQFEAVFLAAWEEHLRWEEQKDWEDYQAFVEQKA
ncbi:hypothetical protein Dimus_035566 [Dionaea muscipula]